MEWEGLWLWYMGKTMMNKTDELILEAGTTGNHQVWFTRPEMMKFKELLVQECIEICRGAKHNDCFTGHEFEYIEEQIQIKFSAQ